MKRLFSIIFLFSTLFNLQGMDVAPHQKSIFDRISPRIAGYLYGIPEFFSVKQQCALYGIENKDGGYEPLDAEILAELQVFFGPQIHLKAVTFAALNPEKAEEVPGFIVTNGCIFVDQAWWRSLALEETPSDIKKFFANVMIEQFKNGNYRKELATKIIVDGLLVSAVIGLVTYTVAPSLCTFLADKVPGGMLLDSLSNSIATTATQTCDQFYSPSLCMMAGKTVWSSLLAPGVGPLVHGALTAPVARYLVQQAHTRALERLVDKEAIAACCSGSDVESNESDFSEDQDTTENGDQ